METSPKLTSASAPIPVVVVDDHPVLVSFLTEILNRRGQYRVVGHADTSTGALDLCARYKPLVVILDLVLLDSNNLSCLQQIRQKHPRCRVLVFTGRLSTSLIGDMLQAGAAGILGKTARVNEIIEAVDRVAQGGIYLCQQACDAVRALVRNSPPPQGRRPELSQRELAVLQHIANGLSSREIATRLGVSRNTVNVFRGRLMKKTGLHSTADLVLHAARLGLVRVPGLRTATIDPIG
jgi:DNA-binding NarL/FixJ family response regulator